MLSKAKQFIEKYANEESYNLNTETAELPYKDQRKLFLNTLHGENQGYICLPRKKVFRNPEDAFWKDENGKNRKKSVWYNNNFYELNSVIDPDQLIWANTNDSYVSMNPMDGGKNDKGQMLRDDQHCIGINGMFLDLDIMHELSPYDCGLADEICSIVISVLKRILPQPTMIVSSGRGLTWIYCYRQLIPNPTAITECGTKKEVKNLNPDVERHDDIYKAFVNNVQTLFDRDIIEVDPHVTDHARVCRHPGTINRKAGRYAKLLECNPEYKYDPEELYKKLKVKPKIDEKYKTAKKKENDCKIFETKQDASSIKKKQRQSDNKVLFAPIELKNAAKYRIPKMYKIPEKKNLVEGTGRHRFIFVFYCHLRLLHNRAIAEKETQGLNAKFAEPLSEKEIQHLIEYVDAHEESYKRSVHENGVYIFGTLKFVEFLPISEDEARQMGFLKSHEERQKWKKNQEEALRRDYNIAKLWLEGLSAKKISEMLENEFPHTCVKTVKNVLKRLGLNAKRNQKLEDIDFEGKKRYAKKTDKKISGRVNSAKIQEEEKEKDERVENKLIGNGNIIENVNRISAQSDDVKKRLYIWKNLLAGESCCILGAAGTGKSTFVKKYIDYVAEQGRKIKILAPTGCAATQINGETIHHGLHIPVQDSYECIPEFESEDLWKISEYDVVVIDEIGMVSLELYRHVVAKIREAEKMRNKHIQIVLTGDFRQLAPVSNGKESYAFMDEEFGNVYVLEYIWRQEDTLSASILTKIANGDKTEIVDVNKMAVKFDEMIMTEWLETGAVYLGAYREDIDRVNNLMIHKHCHDVSFRIWIGEGKNVNNSKFWKMPTYIGMPVMFLKNTKQYANGTRGIIRKVYKNHVAVEMENRMIKVYQKKMLDENGMEVKQFPFKPAYAITIHKSQSLTLERIILNPSCFAAGQLYTALSRVRSLQNIMLTRKIQKKDLIVSKEVQEFMEKWQT